MSPPNPRTHLPRRRRQRRPTFPLDFPPRNDLMNSCNLLHVAKCNFENRRREFRLLSNFVPGPRLRADFSVLCSERFPPLHTDTKAEKIEWRFSIENCRPHAIHCWNAAATTLTTPKVQQTFRAQLTTKGHAHRRQAESNFPSPKFCILFEGMQKWNSIVLRVCYGFDTIYNQIPAERYNKRTGNCDDN